jgi:hypothetical protein
MKRDGVNEKKLVSILAIAARTADANADLDLLNEGNLCDRATIVVTMGAEGITLSGTDKIEVVVCHGDSATPTTPVEAGDVIVPLNAPDGVLFEPTSTGLMMTFDANTEIPGVFAFGYRGNKRYVNVKLDFSGTHGAGTPCGAHAILEGMAFRPAA